MKKFFIFETWASCTRHGSQTLRSTNGVQAVGDIMATSEEEAVEKWIAELSDVYDLICSDEMDEIDETEMIPGAYYRCASGAVAWKPGDHRADIGDYTVTAWEPSDIRSGSDQERALIKANLIPNPETE